MKGTEEALNVLGMSGEVLDDEELPEGYDVETSYSFTDVMQMIEEAEEMDGDDFSNLKQLLIRKQKNLQRDFEEKKKQVQNQLNKFSNGDKVVTSHGVEGRIKGYTIDRGKVFFKLYTEDGRSKGGYAADKLQKKHKEPKTK